MVPAAGLAGSVKEPLVRASVRTIQSICWPPIVIAFVYRVTSPTADPFVPTLCDLLAAKKLTVLKLALNVCPDSSGIRIMERQKTNKNFIFWEIFCWIPSTSFLNDILFRTSDLISDKNLIDTIQNYSTIITPHIDKSDYRVDFYSIRQHINVLQMLF